MLPSSSRAFIFSCFTFVCLFSSFQLTWLVDPALVTLVYPNQMQYMPHILQEVSLLDGVDASVHGNGRRFSKTSSYPPCCQYVSPYYLITSNPLAVAGQLNVMEATVASSQQPHSDWPAHLSLHDVTMPLFSLIHSFPTTHL